MRGNGIFGPFGGDAGDLCPCPGRASGNPFCKQRTSALKVVGGSPTREPVTTRRMPCLIAIGWAGRRGPVPMPASRRPCPARAVATVPIRTCTRVLARSGAAGGGAAGAAATPGWIRPTTPLAPDPARQLTTSWRPEGSARLAEPVSGVGPLARISAEIRSLRPANRQVSELRAFWIGERATSRAQPRDR